MNKAVSLPLKRFGNFGNFGSRGNQVLTAVKAIALMAVVWGGIYPALLWSLAQLLPQA